MNEVILGIDQSLTQTGWFFDDRNYDVIKSKNRGVKRLVDIRGELTEIIERFNPTVIVMENYAFSMKFKSDYLGELGGMIKLMAHDLDLKMIIVPPTTLKKFITGKGNSKKEVMLLYVYKNYGFETRNNNIADAFSLHKFYEEYLKWKGGEKFPKIKIECFKKLEKFEEERI